MSRTDYQFEQLGPLELGLAKRFYRAAQYPCRVGRNDKVFALKKHQYLAMVKLEPCDVHGNFLRGLVVSHRHRGQGLARQLMGRLQHSGQMDRAYCFAWNHLLAFYQSLGWHCVSPEQADAVRLGALQRLKRQGKAVTLMQWPAAMVN